MKRNSSRKSLCIERSVEIHWLCTTNASIRSPTTSDVVDAAQSRGPGVSMAGRKFLLCLAWKLESRLDQPPSQSLSLLDSILGETCLDIFEVEIRAKKVSWSQATASSLNPERVFIRALPSSPLPLESRFSTMVTSSTSILALTRTSARRKSCRIRARRSTFPSAR